MPKMEIETCCPNSRADWRKWLKKNHQSKQSVWLVYFTKKSNVLTINWSEAVDEALCYGWIDSKKKRLTMFRLCSFLANANLTVIGQKSTKKKFSNSLTAGE